MKDYKKFIKDFWQGRVYVLAEAFKNFINSIIPSLNCYIKNENYSYNIYTNNICLMILKEVETSDEYTSSSKRIIFCINNISYLNNITNYIKSITEIDGEHTLNINDVYLKTYAVYNVKEYIKKLTAENYNEFIINQNIDKYNL